MARLTPLTCRFPRQNFRNVSLPIVAVGPEGELTVVYAEYLPAPHPASNLDKMQADVRLVRSTDGGLTWSQPATVNQDRSNADQFQPYIAARPDGTLEVAFFDRRHDPENFLIPYLARSSDGGQSWTEIRVSHEWDPSLNPPIAPSGDFIGDHQALVADRCTTTLFFDDTHLGNDPGRDPERPGAPPVGVPGGFCPASADRRVPARGLIQTLVRNVGRWCPQQSAPVPQRQVPLSALQRLTRP